MLYLLICLPLSSSYLTVTHLSFCFSLFPAHPTVFLFHSLCPSVFAVMATTVPEINLIHFLEWHLSVCLCSLHVHEISSLVMAYSFLCSDSACSSLRINVLLQEGEQISHCHTKKEGKKWRKRRTDGKNHERQPNRTDH